MGSAFTFDGIRAGMKVRTPVGVGTVTDRVIIPANPDGVLVVLRRQDFTPEQWASITPYNDPCVFRVYPPDSVEIVDPAVDSIAMKEADALMPKPEFDKTSVGYRKKKRGRK